MNKNCSHYQPQKTIRKQRPNKTKQKLTCKISLSTVCLDDVIKIRQFDCNVICFNKSYKLLFKIFTTIFLCGIPKTAFISRFLSF